MTNWYFSLVEDLKVRAGGEIDTDSVLFRRAAAAMTDLNNRLEIFDRLRREAEAKLRVTNGDGPTDYH